MKSLEELAIKFLQNEEYRLKIRKAGVFRFVEAYRFRQHAHEEYEINYINSGHALMRIEGCEVSLHQGQCVVIPPHRKHSFHVDSKIGCRLTQLEMSLKMKNQDESFLMKDGEVKAYYVIKNCEEIAPLIERIARGFRKENTESNEFLMKISAIEMMITLNYYINRDDKMAAFRASGRLMQAVEWIQEHYIGQANGEWLANYVKDNNLASDPEVGLLVMTMDTVSSCVPRAEGELDKFQELCPDFDTAKIFKADYDGTTDKGNSAAAAVITAHPEIKKWLVTGANEEGCIGAARALESAGIDKDACVVGLGAYMAKDEWNTKGADGTCVKASAYFSAESVGAGSVEVLLNLIDGKEVKQETAVDAVVVTPDTYKDVMGSYAE